MAESGPWVAESGPGVAESGPGVAESGPGVAELGTGVAASGPGVAEPGECHAPPFSPGRAVATRSGARRAGPRARPRRAPGAGPCGGTRPARACGATGRCRRGPGRRDDQPQRRERVGHDRAERLGHEAPAPPRGRQVVADLRGWFGLIGPAEDPRGAHERVRAGRHEPPSDPLAALEQADDVPVQLVERARHPVLGRETPSRGRPPGSRSGRDTRARLRRSARAARGAACAGPGRRAPAGAAPREASDGGVASRRPGATAGGLALRPVELLLDVELREAAVHQRRARR